MRIADRQVLSLLHRILARVLPEDANDVDGDAEYQLTRAEVIESGFTGEYWREVAGFRTELSKRDCDRVLDILDMFRVITYSIKRLKEQGATIDDDVAYELEFQGFDYRDGLEGHMASYVKFLMSDGRWAELKPQLERHDNGVSAMRCSTATYGCWPSTAASRTAAAEGSAEMITSCPWTKSWSRSPQPEPTPRTVDSPVDLPPRRR